jgi:hypothetical protein
VWSIAYLHLPPWGFFFPFKNLYVSQITTFPSRSVCPLIQTLDPSPAILVDFVGGICLPCPPSKSRLLEMDRSHAMGTRNLSIGLPNLGATQSKKGRETGRQSRSGTHLAALAFPSTTTSYSPPLAHVRRTDLVPSQESLLHYSIVHRHRIVPPGSTVQSKCFPHLHRCLGARLHCALLDDNLFLYGRSLS